MKTMKKAVAMTLAATMVLGSAFTTCAAGETSGSTTGTGSSEGHLEKKVTNVELPTDTDHQFNYTIDPERLIQETDGAKYGDGYTFPAEDSDTGVYFLTAEKTYANTSKALTVTNKSSHDIKLTVTAKAEALDTDIALAESSTITGEDPQLYLGFTVGTDTKAITSAETSVSATIAGMPTNFETKVDSGAYKYAEINNATGWKTADITLTGACNQAVTTSNMTTPKVTVTWKFDDPTLNAAPSIATTTYSYTPGVAIPVTVDLGKGNLAATSITSVSFVNNGTVTTLPTTRWNYSNGTLTFVGEYCNLIGGGTRVHTVTFNDAAKTQVQVTLEPKA